MVSKIWCQCFCTLQPQWYFLRTKSKISGAICGPCDDSRHVGNRVFTGSNRTSLKGSSRISQKVAALLILPAWSVVKSPHITPVSPSSSSGKPQLALADTMLGCSYNIPIDHYQTLWFQSGFCRRIPNTLRFPKLFLYLLNSTVELCFVVPCKLQSPFFTLCVSGWPGSH